VVRGLSLLHEDQGGQHVADFGGVFGITAGGFLHGRARALPKGGFELLRDLGPPGCGGRGVFAPPPTPSPVRGGAARGSWFECWLRSRSPYSHTREHGSNIHTSPLDSRGSKFK